MDALPAFSADLIAALFAGGGPAGLLGATAETARERGPPGEPSGLPSRLPPGLQPFAELLSELGLPPAGGAFLPPDGNGLPFPAPAPGRHPTPSFHESPVPRTPDAPPPGGRVVATPPPSLDGPAVVDERALPDVDSGSRPRLPRPLLQADRASGGPVGRTPEHGREAVAFPVNPPAPAPAPRLDARASMSVPPQAGPDGAVPLGPEPSPVSGAPRPRAEWASGEQPIKLEPGTIPAREVSSDSQGLARHAAPPPGPDIGGAVGSFTPAAGSSTAPGPSALPPTPLSPSPLEATDPRWSESLATRVHWMIDHRVGEARIKLSPPELGALDIKISVIDDKAYVQLTANQLGVSELLEAALPRLRELLNAGGLELGDATVSHGDPERGPARAARDSSSERAEKTAPDRETRPHPKRASGQIDIYA